MTEKLAVNEVSSASLLRQEAQGLREQFQKLYGEEARVFRAPGRVNLIGEHTDYNEGFVMPVAMDLYTWVAVAARKDSRVHVYSQNLREGAEMDLQDLKLRLQRHWSAYVLGVAASLRMSGAEIGGANLLVEGKVPMGAGLSSSASVEVATGYALLESSGLSRSPVELAKICQRAENEFAGARCGIMDQMIACCGRANYALILDCRTLGFRLLPLFSDAQFVQQHGETRSRRGRIQCAPRGLRNGDADFGGADAGRAGAARRLARGFGPLCKIAVGSGVLSQPARDQ
jgi:galactokinase